MKVALRLGTLGSDAMALGASTLVVARLIESGGELVRASVRACLDPAFDLGHFRRRPGPPKRGSPSEKDVGPPSSTWCPRKPSSALDLSKTVN